jgi:pyruvate kinase
MDMNLNFRKTKIIATIGPSILSSDKVLEEALKVGVDIFRINFSHGTYAEHKNAIEKIRCFSKRLNVYVGILGDISGPKFRIEGVNETKNFYPGNKISIYLGQNKGVKGYWTNIKDFNKTINVGDAIIIGDGDLFLKISSIKGNKIEAIAVSKGAISSKKGITIQHYSPKGKILSEKDKKDIEFAVNNGVDYIAMSFVRNSSDVEDVRKFVSTKSKDIPIISKIETELAIKNLEDIIDKSDGVMVARGDLGIEVPIQTLPIIQKKIIRIANSYGVPVITATQMLKSMTNSPLPSRAEVTDVVNAVLDGSDAVMLSDETTIGQYPVEAIKMLSDLVIEAEKNLNSDLFIKNNIQYLSEDIENIISRTVVETSKNISARAIFTPTSSGKTARYIARFRPYSPIIGITRHLLTYRKLHLLWGVKPLLVDKDYDNILMEMINHIKENSDVYEFREGDNVVITCGYPVHGLPTNLMFVHKVQKDNKNVQNT